MLNLVTIGNTHINVDHIVNVTEENAKGENLEDARAFINLSTGREIILAEMDALAFLTWWDSIAANVHNWLSDNV